MKQVLYTLFILFGVLSSAAAIKKERKPNVVIIYMDDMGYADVSSFGAEKHTTPNIDKLADEGMKFTNFYAASNICSPSRASILTGCYPPRAGMPKVLLISKKGLSNDITTMAEMLKEQDYKTALIGKWHLGHHKEFLPTKHGFDYFMGTPFSHDLKIDGKLLFYENEKVIENNPDITQLTTRYTEKAKDYIRENKDEPFFLWLCHNMPHTPLAVSDKFKGKSGNGLYSDVMMEIDWSIGEITKELKKQGLDENTLVIVSSDNGPSLKQGEHAGNASPFREGKGTTFEGGHRVPGIFYMPGTVQKGKTYEGIATQMDIFPTVAALSGAELPDYKIDGKNLLATLTKGADLKSDEFFYYNGKSLEAYRKGDIKFHREHKYRHPIDEKVKEGQPKVKVVQKTQTTAAYDLSKDVDESNNILDKNPGIKNSSNKRMSEFNTELKQNKFEPELKKNRKQPNMVVFFIDDIGMEAFQSYGGESYETPNINTLANEGLTFEHCYSSPLCTPSRVKIMTGKYNSRNYTGFGKLSKKEKTFATALKEQGYKTAVAGKWQLSYGSKDPLNDPYAHGFDEYCLWNLIEKGQPRYKDPILIKNGKQMNVKGQYGPDVVNTFVNDFIEKNKDNPFVVYYPLILTHDPFQHTPITPGYDTLTNHKLDDPKYFADNVKYMDMVVGRTVDKLSELGLRENTVIMLLGDNGTKNTVTSTYKGKDYVGAKGKTTKAGTHVPLIVNWVGTVTPDRRNSNLIDLSDFYPTMLDIAGASEQEGLDGISFYPQLIGEKSKPREFGFTCYYGKKKFPQKQYAFNKDYKLYSDGRFYNYSNDWLEKKNLSNTTLTEEQKAEKEKLKAIVKKYMKVVPEGQKQGQKKKGKKGKKQGKK
ncbi:MAG: sulfatase-like hydrolase/transferase [Carboxylicivirga sp.]|jgi:arylsulfatase A-like enzyme|nr:sulfatase-like hydrolase/transferase [Carboxylicivirga sp.]